MPSHSVSVVPEDTWGVPLHAASWPGAKILLPDRVDVRHEYFGGKGRIVATVKVDSTPTDIPVRRRVRLVHEQSGIVVAETWSRASDGEYRFEYIALGVRWVVYSLDHTEVHRAEIADRLYAEPMP